MKSAELSEIQKVVFTFLAILAGIEIVCTSALYCAYYWNKLRERKLLGDAAIVNVFFSQILVFMKHIIGTLYDKPEGDIYWVFIRKTITRYASICY